MFKKLNNFLHGAGQVLILFPEAEYRYPEKGDFAQDTRNLREDFNHVSRDLYYATEKYGQIPNNED